jgi:hypothetical protein
VAAFYGQVFAERPDGMGNVRMAWFLIQSCQRFPLFFFKGD